jgi:hypothetical protein
MTLEEATERSGKLDQALDSKLGVEGHIAYAGVNIY